MVYKIEILGIFFAFLMIYLTYTQYKRKTIGKSALYLWISFWIAGFLLIVFHQNLNSILDPLNVIRILDLYMILSFIFLFAVMFYLYIRLNKTTKRLEDLARTVTLKEVKKIKFKERKRRVRGPAGDETIR